jgi:hypothetical protein
MITVEIRSYNLKPGTREEFHRLATEQAIPMLRKWKVDVISQGPSAHDENSYFLIRASPISLSNSAWKMPFTEAPSGNTVRETPFSPSSIAIPLSCSS